MEVESEIKSAIKEKKLVLGSSRALKNAKKGDLKMLIYASNCTGDVLRDVTYYSNNSSFESKRFRGNSRQLGEICGKPFNVMLLGIRK